ncbi:MAG: hypothetical protein LBT05_11430 [Planctomycetaceae bacterium]|nr:hypothetical protein [Planctomycetaceae bacterium]
MKKTVCSVLAMTLFAGLACFNFSHTSISQVDLDKMFGGGQCPGSVNCSSAYPSNPQGGQEHCVGTPYETCVDSPSNTNGTCQTTFNNENPVYCGVYYVYLANYGQWNPTARKCNQKPNQVVGNNCAG